MQSGRVMNLPPAPTASSRRDTCPRMLAPLPVLRAVAARTWVVRVLGYLAVVALLTWPLALNLGTSTLGFPNVDSQDTVMLRGLVAELLQHPWDAPLSTGIYFPVGVPVLHLTPNLLDHLTGAPLAWLLPFPWSDNLWWVLVLLLNGLSAHHLGRKLGGTEAAGWLAGLAWLSAEPLLREANLHHAPQAMAFWAPLYLSALLDAVSEDEVRRQRRHAAVAALWLALAALSYWYYGLFLALATVPLLLRLPVRALVSGTAVLVVLCGPALLPQLLAWGDLPLTSGTVQPAPATADASYAVLPDKEVFVAQHASDLLFWLRRTPMDLANRVSLVLLAAAVVGSFALPRRTRRALWWPTVLGSVMVLGPYLRVGDELLVVGESVLKLPFQWMRDLHPFLARLTWSERFGVLIPLGLVALASRVRWPGWVAALVLLENLLVSANAPLQTTSVRHQSCWSEIPPGDRAVLVLPFKRPGLRAPRVGVQQRFHGRPLVNPVLLPPGAETPAPWSAWLDSQPLVAYLKAYEDGQWPDDPGPDAVRLLREAGVGAIVLDVEPGGPLTPGGINRYRTGLVRHFGEPADLGCAMVWWMDPDVAGPAPHPDPAGWRAAAIAWKQDHPAPLLDTLIQPIWDKIQHQPGRVPDGPKSGKTP